MSTSAIEIAPRATDVSSTETELIVRLADHRTIIVPLSWYPRLFNATAEQRANYELLGEGEYIHWLQVDEDICKRPPPRYASSAENGRRKLIN
jgi:hypothetical protein